MILTYSIRSILAQRSTTAIALCVLGSTTALVAVLFALSEGFVQSARAGSDPRVAVVLNEGRQELNSELDKSALDRMSVMRGVAHEGTTALIAPMMVRVVPLLDADKMRQVTVRGVDELALRVHDSIRIQGRFPRPGEAGVVIGRAQLGRYQGFVENGQVALAARPWPVLGVLDAPDLPFESEVWCDRSFLKTYFKRGDDNIAYVRLAAPDALAGFASEVSAMKDQHLRALSEGALRQEQLADLSVYFDFIHLVQLVLVVVMIFASANTIYTSFLGRMRELATLMAIGYTRGRVMLMMTTESLLLTCAGGALGLVLALLSHGHRVALEDLSLVYSVRVTWRVLALGAGIAVVTGLVASVVANIQIFRIRVLDSLRE